MKSFPQPWFVFCFVVQYNYLQNILKVKIKKNHQLTFLLRWKASLWGSSGFCLIVHTGMSGQTFRHVSLESWYFCYVWPTDEEAGWPRDAATALCCPTGEQHWKLTGQAPVSLTWTPHSSCFTTPPPWTREACKPCILGHCDAVDTWRGSCSWYLERLMHSVNSREKCINDTLES